ncbi:MAG: ATP-dependent DNA ligase [Chloroflexi bacterium]|nr:ATP-dependent DNA ligase [Chloroflexota bacterium]
MALERYARKRDFAKTPEPSPSVAPRPEAGPLRFVIQKHAARRMHYDLRLEANGVLKSWAVPKGPSLDPAEKRLAVQVEDHPLEYGTFEGSIPRGEYGAGEVIVWDTGTYAPDEGPSGADLQDRTGAELAVLQGIEDGKVSVTFFGQKLRGSFALVRIKGKNQDWLLIKHSDEFADAERDVLRDDRSVLSGSSVSDVRSGRAPEEKGARIEPQDLDGARSAPFPESVAPMLPTLTQRPFSHAQWIFEPKLDGIRVMARVREDSVRLSSRLGADVTSRYPAVVHELRRQEHELVLDGEIVALDTAGRPSFELLQERMHLLRPADIKRADQTIPVVYYIFDLIYADGHDLRRSPLLQRRRLLAQIIATSDRVRLVDFIEEEGETAYQAFLDYGLEGAIAKEADSAYEPGRRARTWLKVKGTLSEDFVVVGYTDGEGARASTFGALALGSFGPGGKLLFVSTVGSGFDDRTLRQVKARLDDLHTDAPPVDQVPAGYGVMHWVRPEMVVEVKFNQRTQDGRLRAPVFLRLREDKAPAEAVTAEVVEPPTGVEGGLEASPSTVSVLLEQLDSKGQEAALEVNGRRIQCTHLDKVLWPAGDGHPAITKRDLLKYLVRVSGYMLPHLKDRPLTLVRCPDGIKGERFYQKHIELGLPEYVETVRLFSEHNVGDGDYLLCNNLATLLWLGQMAALELHPWYSRVSPEPDGYHLGTEFAGSEAAIDSSLLNYPDFVVFDLDPYIYSGREAKGEEPELNRTAYEKTCEVAFWLKEMLSQLGLTPFVKTSGRTGLHVFVPILRQLDYDTGRSACETIGRFLLRSHPKEITMEWTVRKRSGKVFFDHNQNVRGKTLAAAFSPRLSPEGAVSMPVAWNEITQIYPPEFTVLTAIQRIESRGDPWAGILDAKHDIRALIGLAQ